MTYRRAGCGKATCPVLRGAWVATDALGSPMVELGTHSATERAELDTLHLPESVHREHPAYSTWAAKLIGPGTIPNPWAILSAIQLEVGAPW